MKKKHDTGAEEKASSPQFVVIDRRHKHDESASVQPQPRFPTFVEQLQQRLAAKDQQLKDYIDKLQQENQAYKQRLEKEVLNRLVREKIRFVSNLLPVLDNFGRAIASAEAKHSYNMLLQGLKQVRDQFWAKLQAEGVNRVETIGKPFDPNTQEAAAVVEVKKEKDDNLVLDELEVGYMLDDKLIRPAKVKVGQVKSHK
jgi:molecular chaperone GrpE